MQNHGYWPSFLHPSKGGVLWRLPPASVGLASHEKRPLAVVLGPSLEGAVCERRCWPMGRSRLGSMPDQQAQAGEHGHREQAKPQGRPALQPPPGRFPVLHAPPEICVVLNHRAPKRENEAP